MAATVEIDEQNGAGAGTLTHNITNSNMGSTDAVNLDPVANPLAPGNNTYEKYQLVHVTAMGGSSKIDNLKIWRTGSLGTGGTHTHVTNARTSSYVATTAYTAAIATASTAATQAMPSSAPGSANLGIASSLAGSLTATGSSDFLIHQIQTTSGATAGSTTTMNYQYDETA